MSEIELSVSAEGVGLPASLSLPPSRPLRSGLITLHGASDGSRHQFLFRHLAEVLPALGVAVLSFDRRPSERDVPFETQAADALAALRTLRAQPGLKAVPIGLWGFSQGAWAAAVAAADSSKIAYLVLVSSAGTTPAVQMRYGTAKQLELAGYGADDQAELAALRAAFEAFQRGERERAAVQALIDQLAARPWFPLVYVPRSLGAPGSWKDMDFDPAETFARIRCPVLLFYGEDDEWVPIEESIAAWRRAMVAAGNADLTIARLPGTLHYPTFDDGRSIASISPLYTEHLLSWLTKHTLADG